MAEAVEVTILRFLDAKGTLEDSREFAKENPRGKDEKESHQIIVGALKSLACKEMVTIEEKKVESLCLTPEGEEVVANGSPESKLWPLVPCSKEHASKELGPKPMNLALSVLTKEGWVESVKGEDNAVQLVRKEGKGDFVDTCQQQCMEVQRGEADPKVGAALKKRKMVAPKKEAFCRAEKGANFSLEIKEEATELTAEMLATGSWKEKNWKDYNFVPNAPSGGQLHPLMEQREEFRRILMSMGFAEMPTNNYVENSFWCFDTLFVAQQHPARESQDTFFIKSPEVTPQENLPKDYLELVSETHKNGTFGSRGYRCEFSNHETSRNVLRTHTTACTSRVLKKMAETMKTTQNGFPGRYFSIDRVFRNEKMDATHLCEFHQVEGFIVDKGLSLSHMMSVIETFFSRIGIKDVRFKPAYNPYTEPSMEIFGYHEGLGKVIEIGNSGVFRPEMMRPMGFDEDVRAIAWGLSLERPTMMRYGIQSIRNLFGPDAMLRIDDMQEK